MLDLPGDDLPEPVDGLRRCAVSLFRLPQDPRGRRAQRGERRSQLVGRERDELVAHAERFLGLLEQPRVVEDPAHLARVGLGEPEIVLAVRSMVAHERHGPGALAAELERNGHGAANVQQVRQLGAGRRRKGRQYLGGDRGDDQRL